MRQFTTLIPFLFFALLSVQGQKYLATLKTKLLSADSVIIVSHETTDGFGSIDKTTGKQLPPLKLIEKGKPNQKIIHESRTLLDTAIIRLSNIITRPFQDSVMWKGNCFLPHHAIFIFKKRKFSFIDMCFTCRGIETSKDIQLSEDDFDDRKWRELISLFKQKNMKYELDFEDTTEDN